MEDFWKLNCILTSVFCRRRVGGFLSFLFLLSFLLSLIRTAGGLKELTVFVLWHVVVWTHCADTETPSADTTFYISARLKRWLMVRHSASWKCWEKKTKQIILNNTYTLNQRSYVSGTRGTITSPWKPDTAGGLLSLETTPSGRKHFENCALWTVCCSRYDENKECFIIIKNFPGICTVLTHLPIIYSVIVQWFISTGRKTHDVKASVEISNSTYSKMTHFKKRKEQSCYSVFHGFLSM